MLFCSWTICILHSHLFLATAILFRHHNHSIISVVCVLHVLVYCVSFESRRLKNTRNVMTSYLCLLINIGASVHPNTQIVNIRIENLWDVLEIIKQGKGQIKKTTCTVAQIKQTTLNRFRIFKIRFVPIKRPRPTLNDRNFKVPPWNVELFYCRQTSHFSEN